MLWPKKIGASLLAAAMMFSSSATAVYAEDAELEEEVIVAETEDAATETYKVAIQGEVTDAGEYVKSMTIDFGDKKISGLDNETFEVYMTSTVDYGALKGQPYPYFDASKPLPVVKTAVDGGKITVYFDLSAAPVLTWLGEGRNYPAILGFTVNQVKELTETAPDGRELAFTAAYECDATSWADLENDELAKFENVQDEINYQFHKGTNDKLIVFFHGNGEGDFPTKDTNNNVAQILANRGGAAWVSEAQEVFGDASVMAFQAPNMWYFAVNNNLLEPCYNEIQEVIEANGINPDEVYLSGASAGGFMSTRMIIAYPDLFKAAMINCPALDAANARSGSDDAIPTDEELAALKDSDTAIWLVQGETDSSVDPEECSKRIWNIITEGEEVSEKKIEGDKGIASGFTTYETADGKYKLSLYETFDLGEVTGISGEKRQGGKLKFAEDYDQDGEYTEVKYSDHWSWIYTLRNNPEAADGTHIWQWAVNYTPAEEERDIEAEKAAFKAALEKDGYAELGSYKVEKMTDGVYHMDEETKAVPGGATIPDYIDRETGETKTGVMNNPSSMYMVVNEKGLTMIDAGDVLRSQEKYDSARAILEVMSDGKPISFIITHGHSDHVRLITTEGLLDGLNVEKVYVDKDDYKDGSVVGSTTGTPLPVQVDLEKVELVKDGDVINVNGLDYEIMEIACHTPGSLAITQRDKEVIFTGDSIGSGFVWAFWMYGDNPLGELQDGVKALQGIVNSMDHARILAGHRWQQFYDGFGADKPNEMGIQYLNDLNQVLNGLADGTTKRAPYTVRGNADDIELSATGSKAKVDTQQAPIDAYLAALTKMDEAYVYSGADKLSIESVNAVAAPTFVIYPDEILSDEDAQKLLDDTGLTEILDRSASKAYVMRSYDVEDFKTVMQTKVVVSQNFKLIGIGKGATFINENLTPYMNFVSGLALIGGEAGETPTQSVPVYVSGADAAAYIAANKAEKTEEADGFTTYVNPDSRFELVVVNEAEEDAVTGVKNAWDKVLNKFGRIGNYLDNSAGIGAIGTWYSRPMVTGNLEADSARLYQYFDSIEAIDNIKREVVTEDLDGDGQLNLWYEYIPEQAESAAAGTVPMVLLMHGNTNDPRTQYDCSGWANIASKEGIILVAPEWQGHTYQGYTYQPMVMTTEDVDSADFIKMIKMIEEKYPQIDASRVYIQGLSAGSRNTYMQGLANAKYIAAGAGQSGPFGVQGGANFADVTRNKAKYDFPIIFFSGDADEYLMGTYDNVNINNGAMTTLNAYEALNDMPVTTADDLDMALIAESGYPVKWDETYTIEPTAETIPVIKGGVKSNDADVEISFNRIYGWGHWNYMPDAQMMWDFMKKYARDLETGESIRLDIEYKELTGTQKVVVTGDDWGPAVEKTIITLDEAVDAASLDANKFFVTETKEAFNWATFQPTTAVTERKVLDVYLSDENGEKVEDESGKIVTVVMYISPDEGSPFYYELATGFNRWVDQYNLAVKGRAAIGEETVKIAVESDIDFYDNDQWISPVADLFTQDTFTATDGTPIVYGEFAPAEDEGKNALFIWLHGAGEGTNKGKNDNYIDLLGNEVTAFASDEFQSLFGGAYVITPQAPTMWMDGGDGSYQSGDKGSVYEPALFEFIEDYVKNNPDVDTDRIIIGGCSNGGYMTMEMIIKHPDYFYRAYPICEAFADEFITDEQIDALAKSGTGIWFTFADADTTVDPTATSIPTYNRLKEAGADVHKTEWADVHDTTGRFTDADGNPHVYAGHWSWIYFDNNENTCDECGVNEWQWLAETKTSAAGAQVVRLTGDDWGAGIDRTIVHLTKAVDPADVSAETFVVEQAVNNGTPSARTVLDAYVSDAEGNKVAEASEYITIDMRISPVEGSPIVWSMQTWTNSWANPYELFVNLADGKTLKSGEAVITDLLVDAVIDVADVNNENVQIPQLEGYEYSTFTAADGLVIPYGLYTPANADDGKEHALIIWNHGVGERGSDPRIALLGNEVTALNGEEFQKLFEGAYVLVPQTPANTAGKDIVAGKIELTEAMVADEALAIDADRVIVGGCSMGGGQTMNMVYARPDLFAAAYPICPASTSSQVSDEKIANIADLPIWFTHCVIDDTVNYAKTTEALVARLEAAGNENVHVSSFEDVHDTTGRFNDLTEDGSDYKYSTHWSWVYFDNNECFCDECEENEWEWLAKQNRAENVEAGVKVAGNGVKFVYVPEEGKDVASVTVSGNMQWYKWDEVKNYDASGDNSAIKNYGADEYEEGMFNAGFGINSDSRVYELEKAADGSYVLTLTLPGNLYYYDYTVTYADGSHETIKDPGNMPVPNPASGSDAGHSLFYVGDKDNTTKGQEYIYERTDDLKGTYEFQPYKAIDGTTQYIGVYLPYGYDESKTYKTVYVSHGGGGNENEWMTIGAVPNILDNLIADGEVEPTIAVTMDNQYFGWDYDKVLPNVVDYIIPFVEKMYSVSKEANDRAFCGLSMGSMTTNQMAKTYPNEFGYFGSFSGGSTDLDKTHYDVEALNRSVIFLTAGAIDMAYNNKMGIASTDYMAMYDDLGVKYTFELLGGAHDWGVWRESFTMFAKDYLWTPIPGEFQFDDVKDADRYFYDPVYWAYYHKPIQITTGTSKTLFSPDADVTRGQMVTFLWRLAGEPKASAPATFTDVPEGRYFTDAIAWASEQGITTGYAGKNMFGPDDKCTREQIVTFLWRYAGKPEPTETATFTDTKADAYYLSALSWAAEKGITKGLNDGTGRFGVGHSCTRAMCVTFLYRYAEQ